MNKQTYRQAGSARAGWLAASVILLPVILLSLGGCFIFGPQVTVPTLMPNATAVIDDGADLTATASAQPGQTAESSATPRATNTRTRTPTLQPTAEPTATPTVKPTSQSTAKPGCAIAVDAQFTAAYAAAGGESKLGCPAAAAADEQWAIQPFEQGIMFWRAVEGGVYIAYSDQTYQIRADLWDETLPELACQVTVPSGFLQPKRGFGLLWCEEAIRTRLGWAVVEEVAVLYRVQRFTNAKGDFALLLVPPWGQAYVFYTDYTWAKTTLVEP